MKLNKEQIDALVSKAYEERRKVIELKKKDFIKRLELTTEVKSCKKLFERKEKLKKEIEEIDGKIEVVLENYNLLHYTRRPYDYEELEEKVIKYFVDKEEQFDISKTDIRNEILILTIDSKDLEELLIKLNLKENV